MDRKHVLLFGTGGTIASELGENGLKSELSSEQLLKYLPDLEETCLRSEHWVAVFSAMCW